MSEAVCLYCETAKPLSAFNREHVLSESFGRYQNNFVLTHRVCEECNTYFANNLEMRLGRGSYEGIERFRLGIAPKSKTRRGVNQNTITARRDGGMHDGAILEWRISDLGRVVPVPQIGVAMTATGPFTWYRLSECPSGDALRAQGFAKGATCFQTAGLTRDDAVTFLTGLDYEPGELVAMPDDVDPDGKVAIKISGTIDRVLLRAVTKIAFNYLICFYPAIASMPQFTPIRRYIRYDEDPPFVPVAVSQASVLAHVPEERQVLVHTVTARWIGSERAVVAQVSLFSWVQYVVQLARADFLIPPLCIDSGHAFNPFGLTIHPLTRNPELGLREVPMAKLGEK